MNQFKKEFKQKIRRYNKKFNSHLKAKKMISEHVYKIIKSKSQKEINILIAGSGRGNDLIFLRKKLKNFDNLIKFHLVEIDKDYLDENKKIVEYLKYKENFRFKFYHQSFLKEKKEFENLFDIIICSEVLEHIWDFEKEIFFMRFNQYLKLKGNLIITVPHQSLIKKIFYINLDLITKIFKMNLLERIDLDFLKYVSHKGVPNIMKLKTILIRKGFSKYKIKGVAIVPDKYIFSKNNLIIKIISNILVLISKSFSTELFIIAKKTKKLKRIWYNDSEFIFSQIKKSIK